jgi:hypothetical protein
VPQTNSLCCYYTRKCHIHTHTCTNYSRVCEKRTLRIKSHSACENLNRRVVITFVRVEITLQHSHNHTCECHDHTHTCQNHTLRVKITLVRVAITVVSVVITIVRLKIRMRG